MKSCCWKATVWMLTAVSVFVFTLTGYGQTQTFTVTASPSALTIYPGEQNVPVTVTVNSGDNDSDNYTGPVVVTLTGLPSGVTVTPIVLTAGNSGTLKLSASLSAGQEGFPPVAPWQPNSWTAQASVVGAAGASQATAPLAVTISLSNPAYMPTSVNLPVVKIDTGGVVINSKTIDTPGTITITSADGQTSYLPNSSDTDNTATFHVHGNSTALMPKLAYNIKLSTSLDLLNTMGVNCGYVSKGKAACDKSKSYILLANYDDKTLLRDWAASALANAIPYGGDYLSPTPLPSGSTGAIPTPSGTSALMPWAPHSLFVELYINGAYAGNYQLIEKVNIDSHRINITEMDETATSGDALTGGYQLEIDEENGEDYMFTTPQNVAIGLNDPDFSPEVPEQTSYITNYVNQAETALFSSNFTDPSAGWRAWFDEASAINFYIVNDVMGNVDGGAMYSSDYFYKDINNPFLYMGPIWDFDISSGNVNYQPISSPTYSWMQTRAPWYAQWFKDPGFKADVVKQWNTLKQNGVFTAWVASIQTQASTLELSQANNFGRWPMQGVEVWPNPQAADSYDGEVSYLTNWLNLRIAYLDSVLNGKTQTTTGLSISSSTVNAGTAITLNAKVTGGTSPSGNVSFLSNGVLLGTTALSGGQASLMTSNLQVGSGAVTAVYSGDDKNALSTSNSQAVSVLPAPTQSATSLAAASTTFNTTVPTPFTVSVIGSSGAVLPTGAVTLNVNGSPAGHASLTGNGTASFSTVLPLGAASISAAYSGDANYLSSTSNAISVNVIPGPDFTLNALSSSSNVDAKTSASGTVTLAPVNGFNQSVALSCSWPSTVTCSFSPATVSPGSGAVTSALTVSLAGGSAASQPPLPLWSKVGGGLAVALLLWPFRKRRLRILIAIAAMLTAGLAISACGSNTKPFSTGYSLNIIATGGGIRHTTYMHIEVTR